MTRAAGKSPGRGSPPKIFILSINKHASSALQALDTGYTSTSATHSGLQERSAAAFRVQANVGRFHDAQTSPSSPHKMSEVGVQPAPRTLQDAASSAPGPLDALPGPEAPSGNARPRVLPDGPRGRAEGRGQAAGVRRPAPWGSQGAPRPAARC